MGAVRRAGTGLEPSASGCGEGTRVDDTFDDWTTRAIPPQGWASCLTEFSGAIKARAQASSPSVTRGTYFG